MSKHKVALYSTMPTSALYAKKYNHWLRVIYADGNQKWSAQTTLQIARMNQLQGIIEKFAKDNSDANLIPSSDSWENGEYELIECWQWSAQRVLPIVREMREAVAEVADAE